MLVEIYIDGLCQPVNPGGIACYAFVVKIDGKILHSEYGLAGKPFSKDSTNNVAEYTALVKALEWLAAQDLASQKIEIKSDSQLVVNQLAGNYKVKSKRILPLYRQVLLEKAKFPKLQIIWIPRERNREADTLTNIAYNKALQENPEFLARATKEGKS